MKRLIVWLLLGVFAAPAAANFDFKKAPPFSGNCLYNDDSVPPPLGLAWQPIEVPGLGAAEVIAWLEPCVNQFPTEDGGYFFWETEVLAVVRKQFQTPVTSYSYDIPFNYSNNILGYSSTISRAVPNGPPVSTLVIPLHFDTQQIMSATSPIIANLTISGVKLSTNNTLPGGGSVVREYFRNSWDHYFMTANDFENPHASGAQGYDWVPTGRWWRAETAAGSGLVPVCRFFSNQSFAPISSHFYTPFAAECEALKKGKTWEYEGIAFQAGLPDAAGNCAAGTQPLYRVYNNGMGGAPNHRYTLLPSVRDEMVKQGWILEGVGMCMPA
jgi:hypothetical protein